MFCRWWLECGHLSNVNLGASEEFFFCLKNGSFLNVAWYVATIKNFKNSDTKKIAAIVLLSEECELWLILSYRNPFKQFGLHGRLCRSWLDCRNSLTRVYTCLSKILGSLQWNQLFWTFTSGQPCALPLQKEHTKKNTHTWSPELFTGKRKWKNILKVWFSSIFLDRNSSVKHSPFVDIPILYQFSSESRKKILHTWYRKIPKLYSDTWKIAVIILKFEQCGSTVE